MNESIQDREVRSLNIQIFASFLYLVVISVSIILLENSKRTIKGQTPFLEIDDKLNILLLNRIVALVIVGMFLYASYKNIEVAKLKEQELDSFYLEFISSILSSLSSIIVLIVAIRAFDNNSFSLANLENPES